MLPDSGQRKKRATVYSLYCTVSTIDYTSCLTLKKVGAAVTRGNYNNLTLMLCFHMMPQLPSTFCCISKIEMQKAADEEEEAHMETI